MAIIDVVKSENPPNIYAWKHPETNLTTWTQLIVNESQEAILFHKGKLVQKFTPGKHTLNTENIPILENLFGIPFGGKNPFTAEIWFVNKVSSLDIKWGTPTPLQLRDPEYKIIIPIRSHGQFGIRISDSEKFLVKLVGTLQSFGSSKLTEYFRALLLTYISSLVAQKTVEDKICIIDLPAKQIELSEFIFQKIKPKFDEYGIELLNFYIQSINPVDNDPSVEKLKSLLGKKTEMDILGYSYQQERSYDVLNGAANNQGASNNVMGSLMGLGVGFGVSNIMKDMFQGVNTEINNSNSSLIECLSCKHKISPSICYCPYCGKQNKIDDSILICDKCKNPISKHTKYCSECGDKYNPCENCGTDNPENAKVCIKCNKPFPKKCTVCGNVVNENSKFCTNCGSLQVKRCGKCGKVIQQNINFCPECGEKIV